MYKEKIIDIKTGEVSWRDYTDAEIAEVEAAKAEVAQQQLLQADADAKKKAAQAKLAELGLTAEDLRALGL